MSKKTVGFIILLALVNVPVAALTPIVSHDVDIWVSVIWFVSEAVSKTI